MALPKHCISGFSIVNRIPLHENEYIDYIYQTGWWFQPNLKNIGQLGNLPEIAVKIKIV